ncbi:MAG: HAD family phosphatase [Candidatus Marinimicrobia bacterium]|nr:HAD family phosphatase [Candidatus Neomarinimicrobiota bacterium]
MLEKYGLLLDFDGVVVDSEPLYEKAMNVQFSKYGISVQPEDWLFFKGKDAKAVFPYIRDKYDRDLDTERMERDYRSDLLREFRDHMDYVPGFPGFFRETLDDFTNVLVTSTSREIMEWTFANVAVENVFSHMITSTEVRRTKPHPEPYLKAAEMIGIPVEKCVVIEDSVNGIRSGLAAGAKVVAITSTFPGEVLQEADLIVQSYDELSAARLIRLIREDP